jgi:hypothetical protein
VKFEANEKTGCIPLANTTTQPEKETYKRQAQVNLHSSTIEPGCRRPADLEIDIIPPTVDLAVHYNERYMEVPSEVSCEHQKL